MAKVKETQEVTAFITNSGNIVERDILKGYQTKGYSKQIDDINSAWSQDIVEPPYDLVQLMLWGDQNVYHSSSIRVKTQDSIGLGYQLNNQDEDVQQDKETNASYKKLDTFFKQVNESESLITVLKRVFLDFESCGNGYIEIGRGKNNEISSMYHINATTVRWTKDKKRLVQRAGGVETWFKMFGSEEILNRNTGQFVNSINKPEDEANEIIPVTQYSWKSALYGVPEWLPAIYAMWGDMEETSYNISFFEHFGVPAYAIIMKGGTMTPEVKKEIKAYFETTLKKSAHKTLTLATPQGAELTFTPLAIDTKEASFRFYKKDNRDVVLSAHRVPPYRLGISESGSLGGNVAYETDRIYLESVINPRQESIEWIMNELIIKQGFKIEDWTFTFKDINVVNRTTDAQVFGQYLNSGVMTPNEIRQALGLDPYKGGDVFYASSGLIPVGVTAGAEMPEVVAPEVVPEESNQGAEERSAGKETSSRGDIANAGAKSPISAQEASEASKVYKVKE